MSEPDDEPDIQALLDAVPAEERDSLMLAYACMLEIGRILEGWIPSGEPN